MTFEIKIWKKTDGRLRPDGMNRVVPRKSGKGFERSDEGVLAVASGFLKPLRLS